MEPPGMESLDSLATVAEVGAALAGFATLAGILRRDYADRNRAFGVVETSLIAVVFSLLPSMVGDLQVTAALFLLVWTTAWAHAIYRLWKFTGSASAGQHPLHLVIMSPITLGGSALALIVVLGLYQEHATRFYASAVFCPLLMSCLLLWRTAKGIILATEQPLPA